VTIRAKVWAHNNIFQHKLCFFADIISLYLAVILFGKPMNIRNIAIIAHVDHGKTTLVDQLLHQSGTFRENQKVNERVMDSNALERERGITITSKNATVFYNDYKINIVDTPGHADFGGEVERILKMVDGVLLLVDAFEGPMPQTKFVLRKSLEIGLHPVVVINKIDREDARADKVVDMVLDLFIELDADEAQLDFAVIFASAKQGYAGKTSDIRSGDFTPLFETIIEAFPAPSVAPEKPFQMLVSSLEYSSFVGRMAIGKILRGKVAKNDPVVLLAGEKAETKGKISNIYQWRGLGKEDANEAVAGDIVCLAGLESAQIGNTICAVDFPEALPPIYVDEPTISMNFIVNNSPFSGQDGKYLTSRHIYDRLQKELLSNVALRVDETDSADTFKVSGRGELHLSILIETMRREGYEFQVSRPEVIFREENGQKTEPYEELFIDVPELYMGTVIEKIGQRKGEMQDMQPIGFGINRVTFIIPARGLIGFRSDFLTDTKGEGTMHHIFWGYGAFKGAIPGRRHGVLIAKENGSSLAYALFNLQERGELFIGPGTDVYAGQIVGECNRDNDLTVNVNKGKKLTNMRAAGSDDNVILSPPRKLTLEACLEFINDDELVEVTPQNIRLRKKYLDENDRKRYSRQNKSEEK
jgi:GTP-binding protein